MDISDAIASFAALSQPTRLNALRALISAGSKGMSAGALADHLGVLQNTLSANLTVLLNAGLVRNERQGRSIRYFAEMDQFSALIGFMMQDCCGGRPELCQPVLDELKCAC